MTSQPDAYTPKLGLARHSRDQGPGRGETGEQGAALVEFALILPLMLLLLLSMLDFGRAINYWIDENHLANEAARWAVVDTNPGGGASLQDYVVNQADTVELQDGAVVCINFPGGGSEVGDPVEATMDYEYQWMPFLGLDATSTTIRGSATMRLEAEPSNYSSGCSG